MHDENYISPKFVHQESILNKYQLKNEYAHTWQIPGLTLVKINLRNDFELYLFPVDLPLKVVDDEFLISGMEPETWRQTDGRHCSLCSSSQNSHRNLLELGRPLAARLSEAKMWTAATPSLLN